MGEGDREIRHDGSVTGRIAPRRDRPDGGAPGQADPGAVERVIPWRTGVATGVGSLPGTDPLDAAALVAGELPDLPHLVELPGRGVGADMIGRATAILLDMPAEVVPSGWRLTRRPGRDVRRANDLLAWDLDAAGQHFAGAEWVKVQVAGPWTLAAGLELPSGNRALLDGGAVDDLAASLADGLAEHVRQVTRRLPGARVVVQVDEPSLPAVLAGILPTASGFGAVAAVDEARAREVLSVITASLAGRHVLVHCCHRDIPIALLRRAGFGALSMDLTAVGTAAARIDPIGEAVEAGTVLLAGLVPTREPAAAATARADDETDDRPAEPAGRYDFRAAAAPVLNLWHRLGLPDSRLAQVLVTPTCGLATAPSAWARRALAVARDAARLLGERAAQG